MQNIHQQKKQNSAAQLFWYRCLFALVMLSLILLGKNSMPMDTVACIQDGLLKLVSPITTWISHHQSVGNVLMAVSNFIVDAQFICTLVYWFLYVKYYRFPLSLIMIGSLKGCMNYFFKTSPIPNSFVCSRSFPSLLVFQGIKYDYYFSAQISLLVLTLFEFRCVKCRMGEYLSWISLLLVSVILVILKQNYMMDIFTGGVASCVVYVWVSNGQLKLWECQKQGTQEILKEMQKF